VDHDTDLEAELRSSGGFLWSSVECDVRPRGVVVYARLCTHETFDIEGALVRSERLITSVLARHLAPNRTWVAAVQWHDRLCRTFTARPESRIARSRP
jgi:hypothetical protein